MCRSRAGSFRSLTSGRCAAAMVMSSTTGWKTCPSCRWISQHGWRIVRTTVGGGCTYDAAYAAHGSPLCSICRHRRVLVSIPVAVESAVSPPPSRVVSSFLHRQVYRSIHRWASTSHRRHLCRAAALSSGIGNALAGVVASAITPY